MESVGRLAGGVAHDFNNLLTVILSLANFLSDRSTSTRDREDLGEIESAALRAAELTQQLLAFARRQIVEPRVLDLNELVTSLDKMLRRVIGEDIELATIAMPNLGRIRADPGRIEQVLMNLVVNARDAMEGGGKLTIETANVELGADYAANHPDVEPGSYVMLSVSDTGGGMDARTMTKIFEPFFTTKVPGKGTGLGLATCYGIVRQSGGSIWVYSEVGKGSTFKVYLPRVSDVAQALSRPPASAAAHGQETLLVVEDDEMVRRVAVRILRAKGYVVHETGDPRAALAIFDQLGRAVDLLVADVVMSGMSGKDLADRLRGMKHDLRVLYTSGYTENTIVHHGVVDPDVNFLAKPYLPEDLARCVREALDKSGSGF
jgi:CheY-like chemotaxis protein